MTDPLIPIPQSPIPTPAENVAQALIEGVNGEHFHDIGIHKNLWETLWENTRATPQEVFDVLGPRGALVLQAGSIQVAHLTASAQTLGKTAAEILGHEKYLTTAKPVTVNPDGSITVENS